jgi:GNAT superfamily N-acetyltransferase
MPFEIKRLDRADMQRAAVVMRASFDERLPWLAGLHSAEEDRAFFTDHLFPQCEIWGAVDGQIFGIIAFKDGWVEQLYILPERQGEGAGRALLDISKRANSELHLWTFKRNSGARRFYERQGFVALRETDGRDNEEREPDVLYRWQRI